MRLRVVFLAAVLVVPWLAARAARAQDDDWSVTRRPRHGGTATRPGRTSRHPIRPSPIAPADRRSRMIALLTESVLRGAADDSAPLAVLLRLVRERDGSIDRLVTEFEQRARNAPRDIAPHLALGHLYREAGRFEDALREYAIAGTIAPSSPAPPRAAAALLQRMARHAEARTAYERALALTTDRRQQSELLRQLIDLSLATNDVTAARSYHQRLVSLDRSSVTVRRELADALLSRRLFAEAAVEYQALVRALAGDNRVLPRILRDLGRAYAGNNQYDEALRAYRRALALAGSDAGIRRELYEAITEVYTARNALPEWIAELERTNNGRDQYERAVLLGRLHDQTGNTQAAIAAYRRALAVRPGDIDARVRIAQLYHQQGMRTEEIAEYRRLVALAPREPRFVIELAELLIQQGQREEAFRMLARASARAGADPNMHERIAEVYARHGRQQDALREIERLARLDPSSPTALTALGRQYMELGQREQALATWRRILDTARDRARGAATLAEVYADNAMLAEAIEMYREAIRLRPDEIDYHRGLATVLERAREFDQAITEWRRVLELAQHDRDIRRHARESIVRLWGMQNRLQAQIPRLERALSASPPDLEAARDLAEVYVRLRRPEDAERVLRRIVEIDRSDVASLIALERVLTSRGDLAGAITVLRTLTEADPRRARDWYQRMAQHALALHRDEEAIEYATRAVQLNDQDATAHLRLAELYRARNDMGPAIAAMRRALELNDRLFPVYFELADLYLGFRNDPREAIALYRRVIQLAPDDDYVYRAGRRAIQIAPAAGLGDELERDLTSANAAAPTRPVFRRLLVSYYDAVARPLIHRVQQGSIEEARQARQALARLGARALAPLLDALADTDREQQRIALDILGYLGNPNASSALVAMADNPNTDMDNRQRALAAAGALGDPRVLPRLIALQTGSVPPTLATIATWAIAHIHTPAATAALVRTLANPFFPAEVQAMSALGLAGTHDPAARRALLTAMGSEQRTLVVRAAAAYALGGTDRSVVPTLLAALETGPWILRAAAAAALGNSDNHPEAIAALARGLFSPQPSTSVEPSLRRTCAWALARLAGGPSVRERVFDDPARASSGSQMLAALLDPPQEAMAGAAALVRFRDDIARAAREALNGGVRDRVAAVLAALAEPSALAPLVDRHEVERDTEARQALASIVAELVPALGTHVTHPDLAIRRGAVRILATVNRPDVVGPLARAASDPDESIALMAIEALAHHGHHPDVYEALAARLDPSVSWVLRTAAATALGTVEDPRATTRLITALRDDPFEYVRVSAARALRGRNDWPAVRQALEHAAQHDPDSSVRTAAREALESIRTSASE